MLKKNNLGRLFLPFMLFHASQAQTPVETVTGYFEAMKALDVKRMIGYVTDDFSLARRMASNDPLEGRWPLRSAIGNAV